MTPAADAFGAPHRHYRFTDSTNARIRELAEAGAPGGTVVTADEQSAGRGRQGRSWFGPSGSSLLYSALRRPFDAARHSLLPLAVAVAVAEAAESLGSARCALKWPNDVWIEEKKLAGILIESRPDEWAVVGVGINVSTDSSGFPAELRDTATSIGGDSTVSGAIVALNEALGEWVEAEPARVLSSFRERDALAGRRIAWEGGAGVARGIDTSGHLLVETADGQVELGAGEVHLELGEADRQKQE